MQAERTIRAAFAYLSLRAQELLQLMNVRVVGEEFNVFGGGKKN